MNPTFFEKRICSVSQHLALGICMMLFVFLPGVCSAQINVVAGEGIGSWQVQQAIEASKRTQQMISDVYGMNLENDVTMFLLNGEGTDDAGGTAKSGLINIWVKPDSSEYYLAFLVSHEIAHQYQIEKVGRDTLDKNLWFTEGMADVIGVQATHQVDKQKVRNFVSSAQQKSRGAVFLLDWVADRNAWKEAYRQDLPVYSKADLAVLYLAAHYPPSFLWSYLYNLQSSKDADEAMVKTFGFSTAELERKL